jgi:hypothetical protein
MIAYMILAIHRVGNGDWPNWTIPVFFFGVVVSHLFGILLFPMLLVSAYIHRAKMTTRDCWTWLECVVAIPIIFIAVGVWDIQEGNGLGGLFEESLFPKTAEMDFLPLWSIKHLTIKGFFLLIGTGITFPFAMWKIFRDHRDPETIQVAIIAVMSLSFLVLFHPDLGYNDWDLFLFPSLPIAYLAVSIVADSSRRLVLSILWIAVFLTIWIPRIPVWAYLSERGLAEVKIINLPNDARVRLDDRYPVEKNRIWIGGGMHSISVWRHGDRIRWKVFQVHPGDKIKIRLPETRVPGPFYDRIKSTTELF